MGKKITNIVEDMVNPILDKQNLELVEVEYKKEGSNWFLRVFIDKDDGGVDIDDCRLVSEELGAELDKADPIPNAYFLEVSSPGAERPLKKEKDFIKSINKIINITTYEPINSSKEFEGKLISFNNSLAILEVEDNKITIPYQKIANARLVLVL